MSETETTREEAIEERLAKATPGPWLVAGHARIVNGHSAERPSRTLASTVGTSQGEQGANAALIAAAPSDIRYLLTRVQHLTQALEEIAKREGPFSRDPLEHCNNTVDAMERIALAALTPTTPADSTSPTSPGTEGK